MTNNPTLDALPRIASPIEQAKEEVFDALAAFRLAQALFAPEETQRKLHSNLRAAKTRWDTLRDARILAICN